MSISNNKISHLVSSQVPFFVRNDHTTFVAFLEAYYEFLEQEDGTLNQIKNLKSNSDVDQSVELFLEKFYDNYLRLIPKESLADKTLLLKHIKDFYRSRGTEKSIRFLMRLLFNEEVQDFYYPKKDVLRASDGKWFIEKSLKVKDIAVDGVPNNSISFLDSFNSKTVYGNTSNAFATVERIDSYYENGILINELKISGQYKDFIGGEVIFTDFVENGVTKAFTANLFAGSINSVVLNNPGTNYQVGDTITIESNTGSGGIIIVSSVSLGSLLGVFSVYGGAGFQTNNSLLISGSGTGAAANIKLVQDDSLYHPNTYNLVSSIIALEANTPIDNTIYSNLSSSNVNTSIANAMSYFTYANTGPILTLQVLSGGNNYLGNPTISATANSIVRSLGILGRMDIVDGGVDYEIGDTITFTNIFGGYGTGAAANVTNVSANGSITEVKFVPVEGQITGGSGYEQTHLPLASVSSANGVSANIVVTTVLGDGEQFAISTANAGSIISLSLISGGEGYATDPVLNLSSIGDGTATAVAFAVTGIFTYPGRYINDDGHLSGYNFLQNRDYYQDYSYVIKIGQSIDSYRKAVKELIHPAGTKLFGEYVKTDNGETMNLQVSIAQSNTQNYILYDDNVMTPANTTNIYNWVSNAVTPNCTISLDTDELSPFGNTVLKMQIINGKTDAHIASYNLPQYNLGSATAGEIWETRVWVRSDRPINNTSMQIIGFSALANGKSISTNVNTFFVGPDWAEKVLTFTTSANTEFVQTRLDGPNLATSNITLWFDALQVRKIS